jgi:hypothetical protein
MKFSEKFGGAPPPKSGLGEASEPLRTVLWNYFHEKLLPKGADHSTWVAYQKNARAIWNFLRWATDEIPYYEKDIRPILKAQWFRCGWAQFFDLLQFVANFANSTRGQSRIVAFEVLNTILKSEGCAYRFVAEELSPLTNELEIAEVTQAAAARIDSVGVHIREALKSLPPNLGYNPRTSIKESISAVEAALKNLTGEIAATLGDGLKHFERQYGPLHKSLRRGLDHMYNFTNGPDGIRHALSDEAAEVTVDDARFMVVACSAFANYLLALASTGPKGDGHP